MQTFLPYASYVRSATILDMRRLGKQRVETLQILNTLLGIKKGWSNHPAVKMWEGYEVSLSFYGVIMCTEWIARGYKDTLCDRFQDTRTRLVDSGEYFLGDPWWLGDVQFHDSHKSNLLRKDPQYYAHFNQWVSPDLPYVWPVGGLSVANQAI